ncbi:MAG: PAS domain S-box protein [Deltaproteobacteria bacterium]|nr:PAS domain S-box protein [Deltaproteobacteria bacterium]
MAKVDLSDLERDRSRYLALVESQTELISRYLPDTTLTFVNAAYCRFYGKTREELIGQSYLSMVAPEFRERALKETEDIAKGVQKTSVGEYLNYSHDGTECWIQWIIQGIVDRSGQVIELQAIGRDITDLKHTEDALRESEEKYRFLTEWMTDIIWTLDTSLSTTYVSSSITKVLGFTPEERLRQKLSEMLTPESYFKVINTLAQELAKEGKEDPDRSLVLDVEYYHKDGHAVWLENRVRAIRDRNGKIRGIHGVSRDITDRRRAEEALRRSEATLRSVFKATPIGLAIVKDRLVQCANHAWHEIFGCGERDMPGCPARMFYETAEEYERVGRQLYDNLLERGMASAQTRIRRMDGVIRDVVVISALLHPEDPSGGVVLAAEDITDRRKTEIDLKENRKRLSDIIEFLPDATLVINDEGKVIAWNRAMETITGVKKSEMLGKGSREYSKVLYGDRRPILIDLAMNPAREVEQKLYPLIRRMDDRLFAETVIPNSPSGERCLSTAASVLRDEQGEIIAAIECIRDNTEHKKLEGRLNQAEKMEILGTLAGGVAHDLNNILGAMVGYSELLLGKLPMDSPLRRYADRILQSSLKSAAITQDLLTLARRGISVSEVIDLNLVVLEFLETPEFEKIKFYHPDVKIVTKLTDGTLKIKGSPVHLGKVLMNLVSNAAEAISDHGEVTITTASGYLDHPINGQDEVQEGDYAVLTVSDTGKGISANDLGKIFEPFYTKKTMGRSGTGLGLTVVWGTVKDHNGYLDVRSKEGKGSAFILYFPITEEEFAKPEGTSSSLIHRGQGESILVVDDMESQRELAMTLLEDIGYKVETVASGEEAIEHLRNGKADLIILDMLLGTDMDGLETYQRIRAMNPEQRVILVSGFSETSQVKKARQMGAGIFIQKPYALERISLAIRNELNRKRS